MLKAGFADPVFDAQAAFKAAMWALARPGLIQPLAGAPDVPAPLDPVAGALALALVDFETSVWLDPLLAEVPAVAGWLRFHTGVRIVTEPADAGFALIADPSLMPELAAFAQGTHAYPDRSTTLILPVADFEHGPALRGRGPGVDVEIVLHVNALPEGFLAAFARNRTGFPCGVDVLLCAPSGVIGLPRTLSLTPTGA